MSETSTPATPQVEKVLSRTATVVPLVAHLSGSLDVVQTVGLLFEAKELPLVKQGAQRLVGTFCIYELGFPYLCPCPHSRCILSRLISCDLSRLNQSGIVPIQFVLTWKASRLYKLAMNKNFVISRFLMQLVEPLLHNKPPHIWLSLLSKLHGIH